MPPPALAPDGWRDVYLVTRLYDTNLHRVIYSSQPLSDAHVQYMLFQIFRASPTSTTPASSTAT